MALYVGLDPAKDFNWLSHPEAMQLFTEGKVDAYLAFPVDAQELRAKKIGHVVLPATATDPGPITSAAVWPGTAISSVHTKWRRSGQCEPF